MDLSSLGVEDDLKPGWIVIGVLLIGLMINNDILIVSSGLFLGIYAYMWFKEMKK
jgi:hypothetical protein